MIASNSNFIRLLSICFPQTEEESVAVDEELGLEYDQLYRKFFVDLVLADPTTPDLSCMMELYITFFSKHIYYNKEVLRDI